MSTLVGPAGKKDAWKGHFESDILYILKISLGHLEFLGFCCLLFHETGEGVDSHPKMMFPILEIDVLESVKWVVFE